MDRVVVAEGLLSQTTALQGRHLTDASKPGCEEFTAASSSELIVQDYAAEATVDRHFSAAVIDKAELPELIHEKINS